MFICTEDSLGTLDVPHFPLAHTFDEVMETLFALYSEAHAFRTLMIDRIDWLEPLVWAKACKDNRWGSIEDAGTGKDTVAALDLWRQYIEGPAQRQGHDDHSDRSYRNQAVRQPGMRSL